MLGIPEFALSLTLSLIIVVLALAAKIPAASYPSLIAGLNLCLDLGLRAAMGRRDSQLFAFDRDGAEPAADRHSCGPLDH
jgi:hypothetical protein